MYAHNQVYLLQNGFLISAITRGLIFTARFADVIAPPILINSLPKLLIWNKNIWYQKFKSPNSQTQLKWLPQN